MGAGRTGIERRPLGTWSARRPYALEGDVLEARASGGEAVTAWLITRGLADGVNVAGWAVITLGSPERALRLILLDERASPEQALALLDAYAGRFGGPLAPPAAGEVGFAQVPIVHRFEPGRAVVRVPGRLTLDARLDPGGGSWTARVEVALPEHDLASRAHAGPAARRTFRVRSSVVEEET